MARVDVGSYGADESRGVHHDPDRVVIGKTCRNHDTFETGRGGGTPPRDSTPDRGGVWGPSGWSGVE